MRIPPAIVDGHGGGEGHDVENDEDRYNPGVGPSFTTARLEEWGFGFVVLLPLGFRESNDRKICEFFFLMGLFDFDLSLELRC